MTGLNCPKNEKFCESQRWTGMEFASYPSGTTLHLLADYFDESRSQIQKQKSRKKFFLRYRTTADPIFFLDTNFFRDTERAVRHGDSFDDRCGGHARKKHGPRTGRNGPVVFHSPSGPHTSSTIERTGRRDSSSSLARSTSSLAAGRGRAQTAIPTE